MLVSLVLYYQGKPTFRHFPMGPTFPSYQLLPTTSSVALDPQVPPEQVVGANHSLLVVKPEAEADADDSNVRDVGRLIRRQIVAEARKHIFRKVFVVF